MVILRYGNANEGDIGALSQRCYHQGRGSILQRSHKDFAQFKQKRSTSQDFRHAINLSLDLIPELRKFS